MHFEVSHWKRSMDVTKVENTSLVKKNHLFEGGHLFI